MSAIWMRARAELRARWRVLAVLAVLVALFGGTVLAAASGARRTLTSFDRFMEHLDSADVNIGQDASLPPAVIDAVSALPQVEAAGQAAFFIMAPEGVGLFGTNAIAPADDQWLQTVDRGFFVAGRGPDPSRSDEVVLNETLAEQTGARVGDTLRFRSFAASQLEEIFFGEVGEPEGPVVEATVVGIARYPLALSMGSRPQGDAVFSHAFYREYHERIVVFGPALMVKLRGGIVALPEFRRAVAEVQRNLEGSITGEVGPIVDDEDIRVVSYHELYRPAKQAVLFQGIALGLFAALLGLAATLLLGQALGRQAIVSGPEVNAMSALGMDTRQIVMAGIVQSALSAMTGLGLAVVLAWLASSFFPTGFAALAEPLPGMRFDPFVLGTGAAVLLALFVGACAIVALRNARATALRSARPHPSAIATAIAGAASTPAAGIGVRMALEPGRGRTAVPIRSTVVGAVAGVGALVAALAFGASLDNLVGRPPLYGWNWDAVASAGDDPASIERTAQRLRAFDEITEFSAATLADVFLPGDRATQAYFIESFEGDVTATIAEGEPPRAPDEVALGSATMRAFDLRIGDPVAIAGRVGRDAREMTVVGRATFPVVDEDMLDDGAVFDQSAFAELRPNVDYPLFFLRFGSGVDHERMIERLAAEFGETNAGGVSRPGEAENLARVSNVPWILAGALVLLALAAIGHALVTSVRRRARDLAVLKTLGLVRRQVLGAVGWQSVTFAILTLVAGVPLGVVAGRWVWIALAERMGVPVVPVVPIVLVAVVIPAGLIAVTLVIGALPARAAARIKPALVLRSE